MNRILATALLVALTATAGLNTRLHAQAAQARSVDDVRTIQGQVVDAAQGTALRRARVVVSSGERQIEQAFTDDEGRFAISAAAADSLTVRVTKAGYTGMTVTAPRERQDVTVRFELVRSVAVMGSVFDPQRRGLDRAYVVAHTILPDGRRSDAASARFFTRTDRLGEYRLGGLPAGRYEVTAVHVPPERRAPDTGIEEQLFGPQELLETAGTSAIVALAPGGEASNINFTIDASPEETCSSAPGVPASPGATTATIRGRVTAATGEPLPCASVRIMSPDVSIPPAFADPQGNYVIESLPAGAYVLEAVDRRHIGLRFGQKRPSDEATPVVLREGEEQRDVDFFLPRPSIISGTVVDELGEPLEGISVMALQPTGNDATRGVFLAPGVTDDRGRYRLQVLIPGAYVVATMVRASIAAPEASRGYTTTFYPGTTSFAAAARVVVDAGRDTPGIDISISPDFMATVSGTVQDSSGRPFAGRVTLRTSRRSGVTTLETRFATVDGDGAFIIRNVPPGDYVAQAIGSSGTAQFGMQFVSVVNEDPPPVTIATSRGATVEGVITAPPEANLAALTIFAVSADSDYAQPVSGFDGTRFAREDDGSFRLPEVTGPSRLAVRTPACETCYVRSAYVNGVDAADTPFDFGLREVVFRNVEVTISDGGAILEGRVTGEAADALGWLAVYPTRPELWYANSRHVKLVGYSAGGTFRVTGLPPGDYFVVAIPRPGRLTFPIDTGDPQLLQDLSSAARRVTVAERERLTIDVSPARP